MLASKFGDIVVTREVKVETSPRGEGGPRGCGDDEVQLWSPADAEWPGAHSGVEDGGHPAEGAHARAQVWPLVQLGTTVTAKHDDVVVLETVVARPDARKCI